VVCNLAASLNKKLGPKIGPANSMRAARVFAPGSESVQTGSMLLLHSLEVASGPWGGYRSFRMWSRCGNRTVLICNPPLARQDRQ